MTPAEIEWQRKIASGPSGDLTPIDLMICVCMPIVGLIVGGVRLSQGKPSGNKMLLISGVMLVVQIFFRLLFALAR